ncbi:MAG: glycosyltransferase family 4 protein [Gemmatimonadota bacterium]
MRVTHIVTAFPRSADDPITPWLVELVRRQRERGLDARVLAPAYRGGPAAEPLPIPVRRFRYAPAAWETLTHDETVPDRLRRKRRYGALLPGYLLGGYRAAAQEGRRGLGPHVAHVHWPVPHALFGSSLRRAARKAGGEAGPAALVCSFYSAELSWVRSSLPWLHSLLVWSIRTADAVTAISRSTASQVEALGERSVRVVPYGSALADDGSGPEREALTSEEPIRLLFVGRLVQRKGVEVLVRALKALRREMPAQLTIVGEGEWRPAIEAVIAECQLSEHVTLTGRVPSEQLRSQYEAADVFVLPAVLDAMGDTEGLGVVLMEALGFERPVIASEVGGIVDIVRHGETGWLVPPGDAEALAKRILQVAADPAASRSVARRGRQWIREEFSWSSVLDRTDEAYAEALENAG